MKFSELINYVDKGYIVFYCFEQIVDVYSETFRVDVNGSVFYFDELNQNNIKVFEEVSRKNIEIDELIEFVELINFCIETYENFNNPYLSEITLFFDTNNRPLTTIQLTNLLKSKNLICFLDLLDNVTLKKIV